MTDRHTVDSITSDELDQLYDQINRVRSIHHPVNVVAAAEAGIAPECATCRSDWPCQTWNLLDSSPAADELARTTPNNPTTSQEQPGA